MLMIGNQHEAIRKWRGADDESSRGDLTGDPVKYSGGRPPRSEGSGRTMRRWRWCYQQQGRLSGWRRESSNRPPHMPRGVTDNVSQKEAGIGPQEIQIG